MDSGESNRRKTYLQPSDLESRSLQAREDPEYLGRYRSFREQEKTNNNRADHDERVGPEKQEIRSPNEEISRALQPDHEFKTSISANERSRISKHEDVTGSIHSGSLRDVTQAYRDTSEQHGQIPVLESQIGSIQPSQVIDSLEDDLDKLFLERNRQHDAGWATGIHTAKRSAPDLLNDPRASTPPKRRTTVGFDTTSSPRQKKSSPRAQKSNPVLRGSRHQAALNARRNWPARLLASQTVPNANIPFHLGQSFSDPLGVTRTNDRQILNNESPQLSRRNSNASEDISETPHTSLILQPDSRPIPENQLSAEIKAIYSGLVMVESKCKSVDNAENARLQDIRSGKKPKATLANNQNHWPAIISLHRALLQEHHDFFLASQHPAATDSLRRLAEKYAMPHRMWKYGIRGPLELFRFGLPYSKDYMVSFFILSYQMICLLLETVENFQDTWIECLGDLARYRMAIEDEDLKDREIWLNVSRTWYSKASARQPQIGRLYHHQAILARNDSLKQLCLYARSVNSIHPFISARESMMTLFEPILSRINLPGSDRLTFDSYFNRLQAMIFTERYLSTHYNATLYTFLSGFSGMIDQAGKAFKIQGEYIANILIADLLKWGSYNEPIRLFFARESREVRGNQTPQTLAEIRSRLSREWYLTFEILGICLVRFSDENVLPLLVILCSFLAALAFAPPGMECIDQTIPISKIVDCGNFFLRDLGRKCMSEEFERDVEQPVLESMHGQVWADGLIPKDTFPRVEDEEGIVLYEHPDPRLLRYKIVSAIRKISLSQPSSNSIHRHWIMYDENSGRFKTIGFGGDLPTRKSHYQVDPNAVKIIGADNCEEEMV